MATLEAISYNCEYKAVVCPADNMEMCVGCGHTIGDRYLLRIRTESWHESCAVCCVCNMQLEDSCFVKENKLYCRNDYIRLYGIRCSGCSKPVVTHELVMRAGDSMVYHVPCFACRMCGRQLMKGQQFILRNGCELICRADVLQLQQQQHLVGRMHGGPGLIGSTNVGTASCGSDVEDEDSDWESRAGGVGGKRPRTILNPLQRRRFRAAFDANPKPSRKMRETLAAETGLTVRVVQVWFQNQRAKEKKMARRQSTDQKSTDEGGDSGEECVSRARTSIDDHMTDTELHSISHNHFSQKSSHNLSDSSDQPNSVPSSSQGEKFDPHHSSMETHGGAHHLSASSLMHSSVDYSDTFYPSLHNNSYFSAALSAGSSAAAS